MHIQSYNCKIASTEQAGRNTCESNFCSDVMEHMNSTREKLEPDGMIMIVKNAKLSQTHTASL